MHTGRTIFAQVMNFIPLPEFCACAAHCQGGYNARGFSCPDQFLCLALAQLTSRRSLHNIKTYLCAMVQILLLRMGNETVIERWSHPTRASSTRVL